MCFRDTFSDLTRLKEKRKGRGSVYDLYGSQTQGGDGDISTAALRKINQLTASAVKFYHGDSTERIPIKSDGAEFWRL